MTIFNKIVNWIPYVGPILQRNRIERRLEIMAGVFDDALARLSDTVSGLTTSVDAAVEKINGLTDDQPKADALNSLSDALDAAKSKLDDAVSPPEPPAEG